MTKLDSALKSKDITLIKPMVFPVLMYRRESWTITELKNRLDYGQFHLCSGKIPWRREWLPTPVFRPGEFHGLYSPWVQSRVLGCNLKNDRMISVLFQGKPFNIIVIQGCAPTSNTKEAEVEGFYEELQDLLELTLKKNVLFIIGD